MSNQLKPIIDLKSGQVFQPVAAGPFARACLYEWQRIDGVDRSFLRQSAINVPMEIYEHIKEPARAYVERQAAEGATRPGFYRPAKASQKRGRR
jgi:hypothetical protein